MSKCTAFTSHICFYSCRYNLIIFDLVPPALGIFLQRTTCVVHTPLQFVMQVREIKAHQKFPHTHQAITTRRLMRTNLPISRRVCLLHTVLASMTLHSLIFHQFGQGVFLLYQDTLVLKDYIDDCAWTLILHGSDHVRLILFLASCFLNAVWAFSAQRGLLPSGLWMSVQFLKQLNKRIQVLKATCHTSLWCFWVTQFVWALNVFFVLFNKQDGSGVQIAYCHWDGKYRWKIMGQIVWVNL